MNVNNNIDHLIMFRFLPLLSGTVNFVESLAVIGARVVAVEVDASSEESSLLLSCEGLLRERLVL